MNARLGLAARAAFTLLLAWLVLYPIVIVVHDAAQSDALAAFVSRPGEWRVLWASVWISVASVALAAAIGVPPPSFSSGSSSRAARPSARSSRCRRCCRRSSG